MTKSVYITSYAQSNPKLDLQVEMKTGPVASGRRRIQGPTTVRIPPGASELTISVPSGDHWDLWFKPPFPRQISAQLPAIPHGPLGWWHDLHRVNPGAGTSVRVGVIDEALPHQPPSHPLSNIDNKGDIAWDLRSASTSTRAYLSLGGDHSHVVCSILAANAQAPGYAGVVPKAHVLFCAAGSDQDEELEEARVVNSIDWLSENANCDLISVSAGDVDEPVPSIQAAVDEAFRRGTLCFFASGNCGGAPKYPARYPECLAVAALGDDTKSPHDTWDAHEAALSGIRTGGSLYVWRGSATGPQVEFLGAGMSLFFSDPSGRNMWAAGTSFAAPIVVGVAAHILGRDSTYCSMPRDARRANYALTVLQSSCFNDPTLQAGSQYGLLMA